MTLLVDNLPSGLVFEARKISGRMTAQLAARDGIAQLGDLEQQCCVKVVDPGPYALAKDGTINWKRVCAGDLAVGFARIRTGSLPPTYDGQVFKHTIKCANVDCRDEDGLRTEYVWTVRIADVPVVKLTAEARDLVKRGNVFPGRLLDGRAFAYKLPTDEDGPVIRKLLAGSGISRGDLTQENAEAVILPFLVAARVLSVDGCSGVDAARDEILDADPLTIADVTKQINDRDGGFDTYQAKCPNCGHEPTLALPTTPQLLLSLSHAVLKTETEKKATESSVASPSELGSSFAPSSPG